MGGQARTTILGLLVGLTGGCLGPEEYAAQADAEVLPMVEGTQLAVLADRDAWMLQPEPAHPDPPRDPGSHLDPPPAPDAPVDALLLDLPTALETAFSSSREFLDRKETLYLQGLGLSLTRYDFGPVLDSTIAMLWEDAEDLQSHSAASANLGVSNILHDGGVLGLLGSIGGNAFGGQSPLGLDDPLYDSSVAFSLSQPLLRGFGHLVSHEALTQGERDLVYAVRDFELFREDFSIEIATDYFDLVSRRQQLALLEQNYQDALFDLHKSEALRQVDRNEDEDVFLARRRVINVESQLLTSEADYSREVDDFKLRLGLPAETVVEIDELEPPYRAVAIDADSAVAVALHNRLDLHTAAERLQDVERGLIIAEDGLRPDLNLNLGGGLAAVDGSLGSALPDQWSTSAALTLGLPVNRQAERNAFRSAQIAVDRARRDYQLILDDVDREVRDQIRQLKTTELQIDLQREQVVQEQRAVAVTQIRYEAGDVDNRDLLDARASLATAQNELINLTAQHLTARLRLMRNLGVLVIDEQGAWRE